MWNWDKCPEKYRGGLRLYFSHHVEPGSFVRAVLESDLFDAMGKWDGFTIIDGFAHYVAWVELKGLLQFLYDEVPARNVGLWGDKATVAAWLKLRNTCGEGKMGGGKLARCTWHQHEWEEQHADETVDRVLEERGLSDSEPYREEP